MLAVFFWARKVASAGAASMPLTVSQAELQHLRQEVELLRAQRQQLLEQHQQKDRTIASMQQQLQYLLRRLFGRSAEKLDPKQLQLFETLLAQLAPATPAPAPAPEPAPATPRPASSGHGRRRSPADLPRQKVVHDLPEEQKACPCCGRLRHVIGQEVSEQLDFVPAKLTVIEHVRLKYGCPDCEAQAAETGPQIRTAEKPLAPIEKGLAAPGLLVYVIVSKYGDHRVQGEAVPEMRVGPSWPDYRIRLQTNSSCGDQESPWRASSQNGAARLRQVRSAKTNASEPLKKCRKRKDDVETGERWLPREKRRRYLFTTDVASGIKAAPVWIRLGHGTLEPVASMVREKSKRTTREDESTDARHRGGTTRSSEEGRVMRLERRGRVICVSDKRPTTRVGGAHA